MAASDWLTPTTRHMLRARPWALPPCKPPPLPHWRADHGPAGQPRASAEPRLVALLSLAGQASRPPPLPSLPLPTWSLPATTNRLCLAPGRKERGSKLAPAGREGEGKGETKEGAKRRKRGVDLSLCVTRDPATVVSFFPWPVRPMPHRRRMAQAWWH